MYVSTARFHTIAISYTSICVGVVGLFISFSKNTAQRDERSMSTVIFIVMSFVQILGAILVLSIWQRTKIENRRLKEVQCSIVLGGLMIFMGIFFIEDGFREFVIGKLSYEGRKLRVTASTFASISGISLGMYKYYLGRVLDSSVIITDGLCCACCGITSVVSLTVLLFKNIWWAQEFARIFAASFTIYSGASVIIHANGSMISIRKAEIDKMRAIDLRSREGGVGARPKARISSGYDTLDSDTEGLDPQDGLSIIPALAAVSSGAVGIFTSAAGYLGLSSKSDPRGDYTSLPPEADEELEYDEDTSFTT